MVATELKPVTLLRWKSNCGCVALLFHNQLYSLLFVKCYHLQLSYKKANHLKMTQFLFGRVQLIKLKTSDACLQLNNDYVSDCDPYIFVNSYRMTGLYIKEIKVDL